jgi:hypothetical protein
MSQPHRRLGLLCLVITFGTCLVNSFVVNPSSWSSRQNQQQHRQQHHHQQQRRTSFLRTTLATEEVYINGDTTDAATRMTMSSSSSSNSKMGSSSNTNNNNNKSLKKLKNKKVLEDPETMVGNKTTVMTELSDPTKEEKREISKTNRSSQFSFSVFSCLWCFCF